MGIRRTPDYRSYAMECRRLAAMAYTEAERLLLLDMAHTWLLLAEQNGAAPNTGSER
jgi:hypothetical protein